MDTISQTDKVKEQNAARPETEVSVMFMYMYIHVYQKCNKYFGISCVMKNEDDPSCTTVLNTNKHLVKLLQPSLSKIINGSIEGNQEDVHNVWVLQEDQEVDLSLMKMYVMIVNS